MLVPNRSKLNTVVGVTNVVILCDFDQYTTRTSWLTVAAVCVFTMAPSFSAMVLIEVMPLLPPEEGWAANWVLWIRCFFTSLVLSLGICMQFNTMVPSADLSRTGIVLISIGAACGYALGLILLAKYWVFPVPFNVTMGTPSWTVMIVGCTIVTIGWRRIRDSKLLLDQLRILLLSAVTQYLMLIIYPAYTAGFLALSGWRQLAFVLVLPAIKYFMKWLLRWAAGHTEAGMVLVMTSPDLFEALYLFKCMQSAGSIMSGLALIVVDLVQNIIHLRGLRNKVQRLQSTLQEGGYNNFDSRNLVSSFIKLSRTVNAPYWPKTSNKSRNSIHPESRVWSNIPDLSAKARILDERVEELFLECQEVLLVEFIESIVPMFYVLYLVILFNLPNAKYYPEMQHITAEKMQTLAGNIAIYAGLEWLSLVYVHAMLKWRFNLSALHLLSFTLENERIILQGTFMAWVMVNLQFTLVHYRNCSPCLSVSVHETNNVTMA